jgi:tetratricopeptide (TPR) repeat protein
MLTLKRYLIHFIILLITTATSLWAGEQPSEPQTGWDYFARQEITSADAAFKSNLTLYDNLLGEAFLAQQKGDYSTAVDYFRKAVETEPDNPANEALFCLFPEFKFSTPASMASLPALEKIMGLYKKKLPESAYLRTRLAEELQEMYLAKGEPAKAKSLQEYTGCLADWEFVLSPFGKYGVSDLRERFTPEEDMNLAQYQGWGRTASRIPAGEASPDGIIDPDNWVYPTRGICYLGARIEVSENTQGWMGLKSNTPARVWVNGETVIIRDISELTPSDCTWSFFKLHKGENYIVIKIADTQSDRSFILQLLNNQGAPIRFSSLKARGKSLEKIAYPALDNVQDVSQQEIPPFSFEAKESPKLPDSLLQGIYAKYNGWSRQAENIFLNLERQYPQWGYLKLHRGELYFREISRQPASATRYSNQAREIYDTALSLDSSLPGASLGLGWSYLFQNQFDTALEYAQHLEAQSPDTFLAPALKGEIFKLRGWKIEAEKAFSLTTTRNPVYRQAYQMLAELKSAENLETEAAPLYAAAYALDKSDRKVMDDYRRCLDNQGKHAEAAKLFLGYVNSQPEFFLDKLIMGDYALKEGSRSKADNYFSEAVEMNPAHPLGYEKLADIAILEKDTTKALELLNKAFSLAPDREDLADRIQKMALFNPYYKEFDVALESVDTTGYDTTKYPRAAVIYLIDLMVTQYHLDGSSFNMVHQAIKIMNKEGRSKFEELSIPPGARLIYARTIGTDGKTYYPTQVTQTGEGQTLSMYAVEEGAVLDYCYTFTDNAGGRPGSNYSYGLYYFQEKEDPMALSRVTYLLPTGLDFKYRVYPVDFQGTIADWANHPGWKYYQWEKKASAGIKDEPLMPEMKEVANNVLVSTYPDWKSIYLPAIEDCRKKLVSSYWLDDKAQELARGLTTDKEKLEAVYQFVTQKIVSGRGTGGTVTDTLLMGVGSLQDKTLLAKALLGTMKVRNELLLVATGEQKANESGIPMPGLFSRYLIYLPEHPDGIEYLDLGSQYRAIGNLSENLQGKEAILLTGSQGKFMMLPDTRDTLPNNEHFISLTVQPDGNCLIEGTITYQGEMGTYLRDICQDPNKKKRIMDEEVNRLFPGLSITDKEWRNMDSLNAPLILSFKGSSKTLLTATPEGYVFNPLVNKLSLGRYVSGAERVHRMDIKDTITHNNFELRIQIPEGWRLARIPDTLVDFSPFGSYQLQWDSPRKNLWRLCRSVLIGEMEIKPEDFAAFRDFCQKIDAVEKQPLALVKDINPKTKTTTKTVEVKETKKAKKK